MIYYNSYSARALGELLKLYKLLTFKSGNVVTEKKNKMTD